VVMMVYFFLVTAIKKRYPGSGTGAK